MWIKCGIQEKKKTQNNGKDSFYLIWKREEKRPRDNNSHKCKKILERGGYKCLSMSTGDRIKLQQGRFRLYTRRKKQLSYSSDMSALEYKLRKVVCSPSMEVFKRRLGKYLSRMVLAEQIHPWGKKMD